jgi:hypothetical protein
MLLQWNVHRLRLETLMFPSKSYYQDFVNLKYKIQQFHVRSLEMSLTYFQKTRSPNVLIV